MLLFFEKSGMQYQILTPEETKFNYKVLFNNILYWIIKKNLNDNWKTVYKYYTSELSKFNDEINVQLGSKALINMMDSNKGNFTEFVRILKAKKKIVDNEIFANKSGTSHILLKPLKQKFSYNFKNLLRKQIRKVYDRESVIKTHIKKQLNFFFTDLLKTAEGELFSKEIIYSLMKKSVKEDERPLLLTELLVDMGVIMLTIMAKIYSKKFNLSNKKRYIPIRKYIKCVEKVIDRRCRDKIHLMNAIDRDIDHKEPQNLYDNYLTQSQVSIERYQNCNW